MIRVCETKDRFEVRTERLIALLRDAGVSEQGPRTARPTFRRESSRRLPDNMVIEWLRAKPGPLREYVEYLVRFELCLRRSLGHVHREVDDALRLALALFIDFAHAQGLHAGEVAALMQNVQHELLDAMEYLTQHASAEPAPEGGSHDVEPEAWGDTPTGRCDAVIHSAKPPQESENAPIFGESCAKGGAKRARRSGIEG